MTFANACVFDDIVRARGDRLCVIASVSGSFARSRGESAALLGHHPCWRVGCAVVAYPSAASVRNEAHDAVTKPHTARRMDDPRVSNHDSRVVHARCSVELAHYMGKSDDDGLQIANRVCIDGDVVCTLASVVCNCPSVACKER